jgi:hypothetical protein
MSETLKGIGAILIILCFLGGATYAASIDWEDYKDAKRKLIYTTNTYDLMSANMKIVAIRTEIMVTVAATISGMLLGIFFMALGRIIELLEKPYKMNENAPPVTHAA